MCTKHDMFSRSELSFLSHGRRYYKNYLLRNNTDEKTMNLSYRPDPGPPPIPIILNISAMLGMPPPSPPNPPIPPPIWAIIPTRTRQRSSQCSQTFTTHVASRPYRIGLRPVVASSSSSFLASPHLSSAAASAEAYQAASLATLSQIAV